MRFMRLNAISDSARTIEKRNSTTTTNRMSQSVLLTRRRSPRAPESWIDLGSRGLASTAKRASSSASRRCMRSAPIGSAWS